MANKFILEPECEINGDLYVCAKEIELSQNAIIRGNVFVIGNTLNLNSQINSGDLYATVKDFNMKYYGFISRDLHLTAENAYIDGYVYRNSFITAKNITTTSTFINKKDFNVSNATNVTFSGEVTENANINSKNISFKQKDNEDKDIICKISGNLNYSCNTELSELPNNNIVLGEINYSKYSNSNNLLSNIGKYLLGLITLLIYVVIIYLIISKFIPKYNDKLSNIKPIDLLKSLGIGFAIFILIPIVAILLFITQVGSLLGLLLIILYILILILAKPIFIISVANSMNKPNDSKNNKNKKAISNKTTHISILIITIILSLINLIPYVGVIVSLLVLLIGVGYLFKSLITKK